MINPRDPRMPTATSDDLHWKRCTTARQLYMQSGADLWIDMGRQAGCNWTVGLEGAFSAASPRNKLLALAGAAVAVSVIAFVANR